MFLWKGRPHVAFVLKDPDTGQVAATCSCPFRPWPWSPHVHLGPRTGPAVPVVARRPEQSATAP